MRFRPDVEQHLGRDVVEEDHEERLQKTGGQLGRDPGAEKGAGQDPWGDAPHDPPLHRSPGMVGAQAGDRGEHDAGQRSAERQVQDVVSRQPLCAEDEGQYRHNHDPAADTQQTGQYPRKRAQGKIQ